jgi:hypothetical protein
MDGYRAVAVRWAYHWIGPRHAIGDVAPSVYLLEVATSRG